MIIDDTIELMRTLTKSEKRSISIAISRTSKSEEPSEQHFQLYFLLTAIIKDAENPKKTEADSKNNFSTILKSHISEAKSQQPKLFTSLNISRLLDFILDVLRAVNADKPEFKLDNYIQNIQLLQRKGLTQQALRLIQKAKKEAQEEEKFMSELKILQFLLLERKTIITGRERWELATLRALEEACYEKYRRIALVLEMMKDQETMVNYGIRGKVPDHVIEEVSPLFKRLLESPEAARELPLHVGLGMIHFIIVYLKRDRVKYPEDFRKIPRYAAVIPEILEEKKSLKASNPEQFKKALLALANICIEVGDLRLFADYLDEIKKAIGIQPAARIEDEIDQITIDGFSSKDYFNLLYVFISYYVGVRDYPTALKIVRRIEEPLETHPPALNHVMALYSLIASVYFLSLRYDTARLFVAKLLDSKISSSKIRADILLQTEVLEVLLLFESTPHREQQALIHEKIGRLIAKLTTLDIRQNQAYLIQDAQALLATLLASFTNTEAQNREDFIRLRDKLTRNKGDFITDVLPLWAIQKATDLSG